MPANPDGAPPARTCLLAALLAAGTAVDLDCNDATLAASLGARIAKLSPAAAAAGATAAAPARLGHMTSNQLIVSGELRAADALVNAERPCSHQDKEADESRRQTEHARTVVALARTAARLAKRVARASYDFDDVDASDLGDKVQQQVLRRRAVARVGRREQASDEAWEQGIAVDIFSCLLGLDVWPHIDMDQGSLHSQVSPALAYSRDDVVAHARRQASLFLLLARRRAETQPSASAAPASSAEEKSEKGEESGRSGPPLMPRHVSVKIPSTLAGLQACADLSAAAAAASSRTAARVEQSGGEGAGAGGEGAGHSDLGVGIVDHFSTLATTCFSVEQGLAADEAGCRHVSPYVEALEAHFYDAEKVAASERSLADVEPMIRMIRRLQPRLWANRRSRARSNRALGGGREGPAGAATGAGVRMLGASFLRTDEVMRVAGIDRVTLSAPLLSKLLDTPLDDHHARLRDESLDALHRSAADDGRFSRAEDASWLRRGTPNCEALVAVTTGEASRGARGEGGDEDAGSGRAKRMLDDALARFGAAEEWLRGRMAEELKKV